MNIFLSELVERVRTVEDTETLWYVFRDYFAQFGIERVSYHLYRPPGLPEGRDVTVHAMGFPQEWVCAYVQQKLYTVDPIPLLARSAAGPFFWRDIGRLIVPTPEQSAYLAALEAAEIGNGLAFQVHGPNLRNGYVGLGFSPRQPAPTAEQIYLMQCAAQIGHLRYCEFMAMRAAEANDLSPREREVLQWISRGKSNSVIADIMGVSRHTIDTLIRRIFDKLGVNDRTTAALKGLGAGLIQV